MLRKENEGSAAKMGIKVLPNNCIHSNTNKQSRAAVTVAKFEEKVAFTNARFPACR